MIAFASAAPSAGSVPAPSSSSRTSESPVGAFEDRDDVADVRAERGERLLDRLLVADVGEDGVEDGQPGVGVGGDRQAGLRHQREQADRLERDGLAAGVGAGDQEHVEVLGPSVGESRTVGRAEQPVAEPGRDRHDVAGEQRVAGVLEDEGVRLFEEPGLVGPFVRGSSLRARSPRPRRTLASERSISASASIAAAISVSRSPTRRESSRRMRAISRCSSASISRQLLPISTVSSGSRKTVAPDDETSWTMPGSCERSSAFTGMT